MPPDKTIAIDLLEIPVRDDAAELGGYDRGNWMLAALSEIGVQVEGRDVIDLGAGYGSLSITCALSGARSTCAVDAHPARLRAIEERAVCAGATVDVLQANLLDHWPPHIVGDLAFLIGVVEYAGLWNRELRVEEAQTHVFRAAYEALRPGGTLVFASKNRLWPRFLIRDANTGQPLVNVLPRPAADRLSRTLSGDRYRHHIHSPARWAHLICAAGFAQAQTYVPYLSYQFPLKIVERGSPAAQRAARRRLVGHERDIAWGRLGSAKAAVTSLTGMAGRQVAHGVFVVATKPA